MLNQILSSKLQELEHKKRRLPVAELKRMAMDISPASNLASALRGDGIKLIAEVKKASPSKGIIRAEFDPIQIALTYAANGASAISVVTEADYFQGSIKYLKSIRETLGQNTLPLLRKDFLYDIYQIYESRAWGADGVLLIVAILTPEKLEELLELSHQLGMSCLIEVHNEVETEIALKSNARIIGINNRNLNSFQVDLTTTERLKPLIPPDRIVVSESGIRERGDMERMRQLGVNAVLVGEYFMSAPDIAMKMKELL
jgi:indole-3-glycerol phosphate synthase